MATFLYFVGDVQTGIKAQTVLKEAAPHLEGAELPTSQGVGPDGKGGFFIAPVPMEGGERARFGFFKDAQEWQKSPCGKYWAGFDRTKPPTPADLACPEPLAGHPVKLGDGNTWLIPCARRYSEGGWNYVLDRVRKLGPEGQWCMGSVVAKQASLWEYAEHLQAYFEKRPDAEISGQEEANRTVEVLAANYTLGPLEVSVLGLLTTAAIIAVADALLDGPGLQELQKKAEASGGDSTSPGDEG